MIFLLMLIHELGHVFVARLFGHKVEKISIYPFGFSATIPHLNHLNSLEIIFILVGGIGFHLIFPFFFEFLYKFEFISYVYYQYLNQINRSIFLFNLLPIFPLDGGRFIFSILRMIFNYKTSKRLTLFISIYIILILFIYSKISMKIILIFICYLIFVEIKNEDEDYVDYQYYEMSVLK